MSGDGRERPLVSCWVALLVAVVIPLVPLIPMAGYLLRVLVAAADGEPAPTFLTDPIDLLRRGFGAVVVATLYLILPLAALLITVSGAIETGAAPASSFSGTILFYAGSTAVLWIAIVAAYLVPIALSGYAGAGKLRVALDVGVLRATATSVAYFTRWVAGTTVLAVALAIGSASLTLPRLGPVIATFVLAYGAILTAYVWGRGVGMGRGSRV